MFIDKEISVDLEEKQPADVSDRCQSCGRTVTSPQAEEFANLMTRARFYGIYAIRGKPEYKTKARALLEEAARFLGDE